ncbi:FAD/NAD(P)-binding domain-containing protein [Lentinus tigrinus ALCF2SS1-7]|uniref:FAD/NAD(P)-binding domain-containing protein n=1 Tax=Lentinus tigrinus ALCF2SS1-6 TaxID=1328759 RepID=A0A5C2SFM0_9APHY|nr:FAD/NAD(P)-binding domain-containing protein [Lentinus tigrinus ALCF2SS1-6]RPD74597.1 FAD/NAD(P)-binding domain-containing protein [Lentinus tigrinus ALCF2SS1-7]
MPKFKVVIVGAGLSGLAFGIALQKYAPDVDFEIYDAASQLSEIGAGVGIQQRTWTIMQELGMEEALLKITEHWEESTYPIVHRKSDQAEGVEVHRMNMERNYAFHRAELQKVFMEKLLPRQVHLSKRLESYAQPEDGTGPIELRFQDGTTATCDYLFGCDGVRSRVRAVMYSQLAERAEAAGKVQEAAELRAMMPPLFSGAVVHRCLIRKDTLPAETLAHSAFNHPGIVLYGGKNKHLITYPISSGRILNVGGGVDFPEKESKPYDGPWTAPVSREDIVKHFKGWEQDVQEVLKYIDGGILWAIHITGRLPTYVDGRVALVGDAAHAMMHHLGSGSGQCYEDAWMLAQFLGNANITKDNAAVALRVYDEIRRPFAQRVADLSVRAAELHHFKGPELAWLTPELSATGTALTQEQLMNVGEETEQVRAWRDHSDLVEENAAAMTRLAEALAAA